MHSVVVFGREAASQKRLVLLGDQGVSKALAPDTLGVPAVDQPMAVLMLTLKAEQAAIKTLKFSGVELERLPAVFLKSLQEHAQTLPFASLIFYKLSLSICTLTLPAHLSD